MKLETLEMVQDDNWLRQLEKEGSRAVNCPVMSRRKSRNVGFSGSALVGYLPQLTAPPDASTLPLFLSLLTLLPFTVYPAGPERFGE
jgi:hypothetical protein